MIQDEEYEEMLTTPERMKALGFKPQKEVLTNHILPYANELDEESGRFLVQVKANLAKSIMLREMKPACGVWSSRLMKYIRIYGLKFGKEDHIAFIKLAYELMLIPDLEPCKVHKFSTMFLMLTKKRQLISPEELTLPWRPLYDMGRRIFDKSAAHIGMYHYLKPKCPGNEGGVLSLIRKFMSGNGLDDALHLMGLSKQDESEFPTSLEGSFISMLKCARPYFDVNATKEILEEFLPQINPWGSETHMIVFLMIGLPVSLAPKYAAQGHELWFDELMRLWDTCYNSQCGISVLSALSFYASGSYQRFIGASAHHKMHQVSVSNCVRSVTAALNNDHFRGKYVRFPQTQQERNIIKHGFYQKFGMPGVLGCIDGTHIAIVRPAEYEERYFNRKRYHSLNTQIDLMMLFAGLAKRNPGAVDWSPYVPKMFTRFLHALNLPVAYKDMQFTRSHALDMKHVASWIVWSICPDGVVLKHLRSFLAGVESYLQSANSGRWSFRLRDLLRKLAREFLNRVRREREKRFQKSWENQTPEEYKLRDDDITEFINIVLEPTLQAVYSRSGSLDVSIALHNLATLRPAIVVTPLLERLKTSLTSLTEPHRVTAAMSAVAAVARPMLRGADSGFPEGPTHVMPFLMAVLPGLDPNDIKKTLVSLHFILIFSWMVPFIDCSSAHEYWPDLTEEELLTCESTAQMEDFVLVFLDRLFIIIESSVMEHVRLEAKETDSVRSKTDAVLETALSSAATAVLMQCSPKIFKEALRKFKSFATESTFETNVSGSMVAVLLRVFARIDSESTLAAFLPELCEELRELLSTEEALREENPPRDFVYRLVLFTHAVDCDGTVLLKYMPDVLSVLDRALKLHSNYALSRACEALGNVFRSFSSIDLKEWKSSPKDYAAAPQTWLPIREWGNGCHLKEVNLKWHVPNAQEAECAQMVLDRYLKPEVARFRQWLSGERPMCRERQLRSFYIINAALAASTFLPPPDGEPIAFLESQVPATSIPYTSGLPLSINLDGENVRVALTRLLLAVQARMLADRGDDTRGLEMLIQVWEGVVVLKGSRCNPGLEARIRSYSALERALDGRGGPCNGPNDAGCARLRTLVADAARLQDDARSDLVCEAGITPSALEALYALYELSINTYSSVRILAQIRLYWMLSHYPYSYRALVPKLCALLAAGGEGEEWHAQHKGALYIMLGPRPGPLVAKQDWHVVRALWPAILRAPLSEKPTILRLEQAFSDSLHRNFPTVNTRLTISESAVQAAKFFLTEAQFNEPIFVEQLSKAVERETNTSNRMEEIYTELVEELVAVAETPNVQWRRLELAMQMLTFCPSLQTPYPPRAVALMVRSLLHDDIAVRRTAQRLTHYALKQRKRKLKKIAMDPYEIAGVPKPDKHVPGYRKDLEWAIWSADKAPQNDEEWEKPWLRNPMYGFYAWPKTIEVAAPSHEQVFTSDLKPEEMEEGERYLYEFFSDDANVDKLVTFLTVEEKKGKEKFNGVRFSMFRLLFAQFGEQISNKFVAHAVRCAADTAEAPQRFASEIAAAALRAPRYWPRSRASALYTAALDIIDAGLTSVTPETMEEWGTCLATGVEKLDPIRGAEMLERLVGLCTPPPAQGDSDPDQNTSFVVCARLYALQGALGSLKWRTAPLAAELLRKLDTANFIQHPYQNVRETVGSILMTIFDTELVFPGGEKGGAPQLAAFLATVQPRLAPLRDENGDIVIKSAASVCAMSSAVGGAAVTSPHAPRAPAPSAVPLDVALARLHTDSPPHAHVAQGDETREGCESESAACGSRVEAQMVERLDAALRLAGDSPATAPQDHARALNLLTTVLRGCMGVIVRAVCGSVSTQYAVVRAACSVAARGPPTPHDELPRAAAGLLAALALANHSPDAFDTALTMLDELADGRSWWARLACLEFAQPLLFYGLPLLCARADRAERAERFALKLMRDSRLEVRQSAAKLLTGLMHCRALPDENTTLAALMRSCRSPQPLERHCGVLGLCAYLASRPYSLGPRLGAVLGELARHTSAPDPVPATIRAALADFRRTHQDDWPRHRAHLTEDELDLLADLTSPPSYCA